MTEIQKTMDDKILLILDAIEDPNDESTTKHVKNVETLYKLRIEDTKNDNAVVVAKREANTNRISAISGAVLKGVGAAFKVWLGGTWYWTDATGKILGGPLSRLFNTWVNARDE